MITKMQAECLADEILARVRVERESNGDSQARAVNQANKAVQAIPGYQVAAVGWLLLVLGVWYMLSLTAQTGAAASAIFLAPVGVAAIRAAYVRRMLARRIRSSKPAHPTLTESIGMATEVAQGSCTAVVLAVPVRVI